MSLLHWEGEERVYHLLANAGITTGKEQLVEAADEEEEVEEIQAHTPVTYMPVAVTRDGESDDAAAARTPCGQGQTRTERTFARRGAWEGTS